MGFEKIFESLLDMAFEFAGRSGPLFLLAGCRGICNEALSVCTFTHQHHWRGKELVHNAFSLPSFTAGKNPPEKRLTMQTARSSS